MFKSESKSIIAMKGHPVTRKTEFAQHIASSMGLPILSLDDFHNFLSPPSPQPQDLAFGMMCQIAKFNLCQGFVRGIVIDSPLSTLSHLDELIKLAKSTEQTGLVIVECKSDKIYEWQTRFEEYLDRHPDEKAKNWEDVEKAMRDCYDERSEGYKVPKLVVDPISLYDGTISVTESSPDSPFISAVKYLTMVSEASGEDVDLVVYDLWRQGHYHTSGKAEPTNELNYCNGGAHIIQKCGEAFGLERETVCSACESQLVKGAAAYTCKDCAFSLHKECAELVDDDKNNYKPSGAPPPLEDLNGLLKKGFRYVYPELKFRCISCEQKGVALDSDSSSCSDCIFQTHLKTRLLPTVINHPCHQHILSVEMSHLNPYGEHCNCNACGIRVGEFVWYSCKICSIYYHYRCLTEVPLNVQHEHGGHHHYMSLQYLSEGAEDYICDVCFERELPERRAPSCWFYSCQDCEYVAHLDCGRQGKTYLEDRSGELKVEDGDGVL